MSSCFDPCWAKLKKWLQFQPVITPTISLERVKKSAANPVLAAARYHAADGRRLEDDYCKQSVVLGSGLSGEVVLVTGRADGLKYALKTYDKHSLDETSIAQLLQETEVYLTVDHPNIVQLKDVYETNDTISLLMECCEGGELYDRLQQTSVYSELDAARACTQMLLAVTYLHSRHIVHRDLKLENFLYESNKPDSLLKLIDFGFARVCEPDRLMMACCGTLQYCSPDIILGQGYTDKCDLWSVGVMCFMLVSGHPPFWGDSQALRRHIKQGQIRWKHLEQASPEAQDFIKSLLTQDPLHRASASDALRHPWLLQSSGQEASKPVLGKDVLNSMQQFCKASKMQRTLMQLLAQELASDEAAEMRQLFLEIDTDNTGTISLGEFKAAIRSRLAFVSASPRKVLSSPEWTPPSPVKSPYAMSPDTAHQAERVFEMLDSNGDHAIHYSDFLAATISMRDQLRKDMVIKIFNRLDVDHSGTLSLQEICRVLGESGEDAEELLQDSEVVLDSNGEIRFEAFLELLQNRDFVPSPQRKPAGFNLGEPATPLG